MEVDLAEDIVGTYLDRVLGIMVFWQASCQVFSSIYDGEMHLTGGDHMIRWSGRSNGMKYMH